MTDAESTGPGSLEQMISKANSSPEEDIESRRAVLQTLVTARVFVLSDKAWNGRSIPEADMRLLLVSDGPNTQQAMLALFTSQEHAEVLLSEQDPFQHRIEVDAAWALLGVPQGAGVMINPNSQPAFRISPEIADILRDAAQQDLDTRMSGKSVKSEN